MATRKTLGKKKRLIHSAKTAKSAPRWTDLKKYGLKRAMSRSTKRFKSRHWRRGDTGE